MTKAHRLKISEAHKRRWEEKKQDEAEQSRQETTSMSSFNNAVQKPISIIVHKSKGVLKNLSIGDSADNSMELQFEEGHILSIQEV